jgi:predicted dehydrogenase
MSDRPSRRQILKATGAFAATAAFPGFAAGYHQASSDEVRVALVGCGGRGGGAAANALSTTGGPVRLVAMADVFADRLESCHKNLTERYAAQTDVPADRRFLGFEGYKQAMDVLRPGDVVILTTPPAFRWVHYQYAIAKGLNVFMEKPVTVDGPTSLRMLELNEKAMAAGLKVGVGLMSRHLIGLQELKQRADDGALGEILMMRGYRMHGPAASSESVAKPDDIGHLEYQIRRFHSFLWASGGVFNDFYIHHIDHLSWIKGSWPVKAQALGGRHYRTTRDGVPLVDQNFDSYAVEYTFEDGTKFFFDGRCVEGAHGQYSSYVHGTKGCAIAARAGDFVGPAAIFAGQLPEGAPLWQTTDTKNPYQNEWDVMMAKIRADEPHNEVETGVMASLVSSMGRMAAHTGQEVTREAMLACEHEFAPNVDRLVLGGESPLMPGPDGRYPVPQPGIVIDREY